MSRLCVRRSLLGVVFLVTVAAAFTSRRTRLERSRCSMTAMTSPIEATRDWGRIAPLSRRGSAVVSMVTGPRRSIETHSLGWTKPTISSDSNTGHLSSSSRSMQVSATTSSNDSALDDDSSAATGETRVSGGTTDERNAASRTKQQSSSSSKQQVSSPRFAQTTLSPIRNLNSSRRSNDSSSSRSSGSSSSSSSGSSSSRSSRSRSSALDDGTRRPLRSTDSWTPPTQHSARTAAASKVTGSRSGGPVVTHTNGSPPSSSKSSKSTIISDTNSIDSLEARLTSRFGTDLSQWTARDGEYDEDDNDSDETTIPMIASRKVMDPWAYDNSNNNNNDDDDNNSREPTTNRGSAVQRSDKPRMDSGTDDTDNDNAGSRFPNGLKSMSTVVGTTPKIATPKSPLSAFGRIVPPPLSPLRPQPTATTATPRMNLRHLIADTPAGGQGTFQPARQTRQAMQPDDETLVDSRRSPSVLNTNSRRTPCPYPDADQFGVAEVTRPLLLTTVEAQRLANATAQEQRRTPHTSSSFDEKEDLISWATTMKDTRVGINAPSLPSLTNILLRNLDRMGCTSPLATQRDAGQWIRPGVVDVVIGTSTGSGKTLAVLVPVLHRLFTKAEEEETRSTSASEHGDDDGKDAVTSTSAQQPVPKTISTPRRPLQLLVMAPGRELASQIASVARDLVQDTNWTVVLAVGGTTYTRNVQTIRQRHPQILIGTPGRLAELIVGGTGGDTGGKKRGGGGPVAIGQLDAVVLDEFDALLGESSHSDPTMAVMSFIQRKTAARANRPVSDESNAVPSPLQTILCSATASDVLMQSKKRLQLEQSLFLRPGYAISMAEEDTVVSSLSKKTGDASSNFALGTRMSRTVIHGVVHVPHQRMALDTLRRILHTEPIPQQILVFVSDARRVNIVVDKLYDMNIIAAPLHGGMGSVKTDRAEVSKALREGTVGLVVATEMAARGLDAPYLTHVINLDLPTDASHYAHRAGRCGRGRRPGVVINLTTSPQERAVPTKLANVLGVSMYTVQVKNARLSIVDPDSLDWDDLL